MRLRALCCSHPALAFPLLNASRTCQSASIQCSQKRAKVLAKCYIQIYIHLKLTYKSTYICSSHTNLHTSEAHTQIYIQGAMHVVGSNQGAHTSQFARDRQRNRCNTHVRAWRSPNLSVTDGRRPIARIRTAGVPLRLKKTPVISATRAQSCRQRKMIRYLITPATPTYLTPTKRLEPGSSGDNFPTKSRSDRPNEAPQNAPSRAFQT